MESHEAIRLTTSKGFTFK